MSAHLRLDGLTWLVQARRIVDQVDLVVRPGALTGLLGPNGSGKTSLLRMISRLTTATSGRVLLDGADVRALRHRDLARQRALVEQHATTEVDLSVLDIVLLGRIPHLRRLQTATARDEEVARRALAQVGLDGLADRLWHTLSGGERQLVQLARAFAQEPRLLLLDEPTNHLDIGHQVQLLRLVRDAGVTTLAALHDLHLAAAFCEQVVVLDHGRVVASGPTDEVLTTELLRRVYRVDALVQPHPATGRPMIVIDPDAALDRTSHIVN